MASFIVKRFGQEVELTHGAETIIVNPSGYQMVLYVTIVLYIIAAIISFTMIGKKKSN